MDSPLTITMDNSKLNARIEELHDAFIGAGQGGDASAVFRDESRLFLKQVIRLTPPKNKDQGENAIRKDLLKIFTAVHEDLLDDTAIEFGTNNIDTWMTTSGGEKKHLKWDRIDNTGQGMAEFHRANRNRRGRTYNLKKSRGDAWYAPYVVTFQDMLAYRLKIQSHVGRRKAAWGKSFVGLAGKVTNWINRHVAGAKGELVLEANPNKPSVTMINRSPGIAEDERIVRDALRIRFQAVTKRLRLVLSGYSKDMARQIKIERQFHPTPDSFLEAAA